jgi:DNA-directed RNA polymerase omega subunit
MLVHVAAKRIRQMREGAQYLVRSPKNKDIVISLREIAAGKVSIKGKLSQDQEEKGRIEMAKSQREKVAAEKTKTTAKKTPMKKSAPKKSGKKLASKEATVRTPGIKKEYLRTRNVCKVTFRLPKIAATDAKSVYIVGDFNDWNIYANPMKKQKNGNYTITLELEPGSEYQFRYLIDESRWENDWNADKYVKSPYGNSDNSVIIV